MSKFNIVLDGINFVSVDSISIHKVLNDHSTMSFIGTINQATNDQLIAEELKNSCVTLKSDDVVIFIGLIKSFKVRHEGLDSSGQADLIKLVINCISLSYLTDIKPQIRVFQNDTQTYTDLLNVIATPYSDSTFDIDTNVSTVSDYTSSSTIDKLIVQYNETDFQFAKRLASHFNDNIYVDYLKGTISLSVGVPKKNVITLPSDYTIKKGLTKSLIKDEDDLSFSIDYGFTTFIFESTDVYEIGDYAEIKPTDNDPAVEYFVCDIKTEFTNDSKKINELVHTYTLVEEVGLYQSKFDNNIAGASLNAVINSVDDIHVEVDVQQTTSDNAESTRTSFLFATSYSSNDGYGWYFMPEDGQAARLYFPTDEEDDAYVISAVNFPEADEDNDSSSSSGGGDEIPTDRSNPDNKIIKNKYDKQIIFTEKYLMLNNGEMIIEMHDDNGVKIVSDKSIKIESSDTLEISSTSKSVDVVSTKALTLKGSKAQVVLDSDMSVKGGNVKIE